MRPIDLFRCLFCVLLLASVARATPVTFSDTTFNTSDWNSPSGPARSPYLYAGDVTPTMSVTQSFVPGTPSLLVSIEHTPGWTDVAVVNNRWSYAPSTAGAIDSLDFRISQQWRDNVFDLPWRLLVVQNGKYYGSAYYRAWEQGGAMNQYRTFAATGLTSAMFHEQTKQFAVVDPTSNPVFDASGSAMRFGLMMLSMTSGNYTWNTYFGEYTLTLQTQASVPEIDPVGAGGVVAILSGALGLLERRRRSGCVARGDRR